MFEDKQPNKFEASKTLENLSDAELVAMFQAGNEKAFTVLVEKYQNQVKSYFAYMTSPETGMIDDLGQETFIKACNALRNGKYKELGNMKGWLFKIAKNTFNDYKRSKNANPLINTSELPEITTSKDISIPIEDKEDTKKLERVLYGLLTDTEKKCLRMKAEGMSYEEMRAELNIPVTTLRSHIYKARLKILRFLRNNPKKNETPLDEDLTEGPSVQKATNYMVQNDFQRATEIYKILSEKDKKVLLKTLNIDQRTAILNELQK